MDNDPGAIGGMIGGLAACMATVIYLIIANRRRWKPGMKVQRTESFDTPFSADEMFAWLPGFAQYWLYEIEEQDAAQRRIVLSSKPTGTDWGFFFPIQVTPHPAGRGTRVEVGILSRATQWGPFVTRGHRQFMERLQNALAQATVPPPQQPGQTPMQNPWAQQTPTGPPQPPPPPLR